MKKLTTQQGYLVLILVALIAIVGIAGTAITYMTVSSAKSTVNLSENMKAFYVAESGLEEATRLLLSPLLSGANTRIACASVTGDSNLTNTSVGSGTFTVTTVSGSPFNATTTLSSAITNSSTAITLTSTTGFASRGRILIDREAINYTGISGSSLLGVSRGVNNTTAVPHASGTYVAQYQCSLDSIGGIPSVSAALQKRELQQSVQLQEAWTVGNNSGNNFVISHWNSPTELAWNNASYTDATNRNTLLAVSFSSNAEGWAVGDIQGSNFTIIHYTNSSWTSTPVSGACSGQNLAGVSIVSAQNAWAVGTTYKPTTCSGGSNRYTILEWNGTSWTKLTPTSSPSIPADNNSNQNLNAIHVIDTTGSGTGTFGFTVGNSGQILEFNGTNWIAATSPTTKNLLGIYVVSANEAWAVGQSGVILKWNGTAWSSITSPTTNQLNSIYMIDTNGNGTADVGWAVGNAGTALTYNGSSWSSQNPGGGNLFGVTAFSGNDVWAVGAAGLVTHWNGSTWTTGTSNVSQQLNGIAAIRSNTAPFSGWQEVFP